MANITRFNRTDIPGVKKEDIHVDVEGNHISLSAETRTEREEAEYKDGVLNREARAARP